MLIYWVACILSIILTKSVNSVKFDCKKIHFNKKKIGVFVSSIPLLIISMIRYGVGSDYFGYMNLFEIIGKRFDFRYEYIFTILNRFLYHINLPFQSVIIVTSLIFVMVTLSVIYRDSPDIAYSIYLLFAMCFFFQSLNIVRQFIACTLCLYSIKYAEEKKPIVFFLIIALAFGFHSSAIIFIPAYLLFQMQIDLKKSIPILFLIVLLQNIIVDMVIKFGLIRLSYEVYIEGTTRQASIGYVSLLINVLIYLGAYCIMNREDSHENGYLNLQLIAVALSLLNGQVPLLNRVRFYYVMPGIILIPLALSKIKNKNLAFFLKIVIGLLFFLYCLFIEGYMNQSGSIPYETIFN